MSIRLAAHRRDPAGYCRQPAVTELTAVFGDDTTKSFLVATPNTGEPRVEQVRLDLSQERGSGLCGSSFGSCDPPASVVPGPIVYLDVIFDQGDRSGRTDWIRGEPFTFEPPLREVPGLPVQPRIDEFHSTVEGARRDALRVTASFDRPVTLEASLEGDLASQCFTGDVPTFSNGDYQTSYSFLMEGLCTNTGYAVRLAVTDEAGETVLFTNTPSGMGHVAGEYVWAGWAMTLGYDVSYQVNYRTGLVEPFEARAFVVTVSGRSTNVGSDSRCLITQTTPFVNRTWGEEISVEIYVLVAGGSRTDGLCRASRGASWYEASVTTSFTIEEFQAGPIEVPLPLEPIDSAPPIGGTPISVVIQGSVRP